MSAFYQVFWDGKVYCLYRAFVNRSRDVFHHSFGLSLRGASSVPSSEKKHVNWGSTKDSDIWSNPILPMLPTNAYVNAWSDISEGDLANVWCLAYFRRFFVASSYWSTVANRLAPGSWDRNITGLIPLIVSHLARGILSILVRSFLRSFSLGAQ